MVHFGDSVEAFIDDAISSGGGEVLEARDIFKGHTEDIEVISEEGIFMGGVRDGRVEVI